MTYFLIFVSGLALGLLVKYKIHKTKDYTVLDVLDNGGKIRLKTWEKDHYIYYKKSEHGYYELLDQEGLSYPEAGLPLIKGQGAGWEVYQY